jgi:hypothetical protein
MSHRKDCLPQEVTKFDLGHVTVSASVNRLLSLVRVRKGVLIPTYSCQTTGSRGVNGGNQGCDRNWWKAAPLAPGVADLIRLLVIWLYIWLSYGLYASAVEGSQFKVESKRAVLSCLEPIG